MEFFTIGVYDSTEEEFFNKLIKNNIDTFCDIRQRRGVRGAKYAFVNSTRLQQKLNEIEITYGYIPQLAPTLEIRDIQKKTDAERNELKSKRQKLSSTFVGEYKSRVLENFDFETFIDNLIQIGAKRIALFCVEQHPEACHRSIVTERLANNYGYRISHL